MCLAIPGQIISIEGDEQIIRMGKVDYGGVINKVSLACIPEAAVGDYVIVHAGFALSIVDEEEAKKTLEFFESS
ncbi:MAG: HypC/HybG/HupF family hydrogenase formation chaperone [candidate division Zixibacteria bacterium]|nr:HypC/HybG/HupF family hydrogenase formation chaperone [candidate division Zixibacteria bacterium]